MLEHVGKNRSQRVRHSIRRNNYFVFEIFVCLRLIALIAPSVSKSFLIQDKICLQQYAQSAPFCLSIHRIDANLTETQTAAKNAILAAATRFGSAMNMIESLAMVTWSLFVGSFLDTFVHSTIVIMALNIASDVFLSLVYLVLIYPFFDSSPYYLLLASASAWMSGAIMAFNATAFRYITLNTEPKMRSIKFVILEVIFVCDVSLSTYLAGQLVRDRDIDETELVNRQPIRRYEFNFYLTLCINFILIVMLFVFAQIEKRQIGEKISKNINSSNICDQVANNSHDCSIPPGSKSTGKYFWTALLDISNVRQTLICFFKPRPDRVRLQIMLFVTCLFNQVLVTNGLNSVLLQFAQKVYHWSASTYFAYSALQQVAQMLLVTLLLMVACKIPLRPGNRSIICCSQFAIFVTDLIRGAALVPIAFFVSIPFGSITGLGAISIKNQIAAIVPESEIGKIFSIASTVEALVPFAASLIYSSIFSVTIAAHPGAIYHFSCAVMLVSLAIMAFIKFACSKNADRQSMNK